MQPLYDVIWRIQSFWLGLNAPEKIVAAANLAWAGFWFLIIVRAEASGANGWGFILGGIAWLMGQTVLAGIGLAVSLLLGGKARN